MKSIKILNKISDEIRKTYTSTNDFNRWANENSNLEVMHESIAYCIDYSITGNRQVESKLSVMKPDMVGGRKNWFKCGCDIDFRCFIESSFNQLLPIWFDELLDREIEEANEQSRAIEDEISMLETFRSLTNFR